jgi:hypothetical protein
MHDLRDWRTALGRQDRIRDHQRLASMELAGEYCLKTTVWWV